MSLYDDTCSEGIDVTKGVFASDGGRSPIDRILASVQDSHRRYLLYHLQEEGTSDLETAARWVAAWSHECDPGDVPAELHDRFQTELYHNHLPKLADLNIIEYDERTGAIGLRGPPDKLEELLALTRDEDDPR